jgi:RNA polymerase sigma-70 factor (ECF subfamily)
LPIERGRRRRYPPSSMPNLDDRNLEDRDLVARSKSGDSRAFNCLVRNHWRHVYLRVFGYLRNREESEDITQETFIRAYRGLPRFRGESSFGTWLYPIAFRLSINRLAYLRRRMRGRTVSLDEPVGGDSGLTVADTIASEGSGPDEASVSAEFSAQVATALARLKPSYRQMLVCRAIQHRSYLEMAELFHQPVGTIKSRLARAREALRRLLPRDETDAAPEAATHSRPSTRIAGPSAAY